MLEYLLLLLAIPTGYLCARTTYDEKSIYTKQIYFPTIKKVLLLLIVIFIFLDKQIFFTLVFLLTTIHVWHKA